MAKGQQDQPANANATATANAGGNDDSALFYMMGKDAQKTQDMLAQLLDKTNNVEKLYGDIIGKLGGMNAWTNPMASLLQQYSGQFPASQGLNWASFPQPTQLGNLGYARSPNFSSLAWWNPQQGANVGRIG